MYHRPSLENNDTVCGTKGVGLCSIDSSIVEAGKRYYLGVYCMGYCQFGIKVQYELEGTLQLGESTLISFNESGSQALKLMIPQRVTGVDRVIIRAHLQVDSGSVQQQGFMFYVREGNDSPSAQSYDYMGEEVWMTGKGVVIHNNSQHTVSGGQNYSFMILAEEKTKIYIQTEYFGETRIIYLYDIVRDIVGAGEVNTYKVIVANYYKKTLSESDLSVDIHPHEGNPDLYINPSNAPALLSDYQWQSQLDLGFESITISTKNRNYSGADDAVFYISVAGSNETSSYSFQVYISDRKNRIITTLSTESGFIFKDDIMQYILVMDNPLINQNYTILGSFPEGKAFIALKQCNMVEKQQKASIYDQFMDILFSTDDDNYYNCHISDDDLKEFKNKTIASDYYAVKKTKENSQMFISGGTLKYIYDADQCTKDFPPMTRIDGTILNTRCTYIVAVFATQNTRFILTLKDEMTRISLNEGQPQRSNLMQKDQDHFYFQIFDQIESVEFQITVLNGDIKVWASSVSDTPGPDNFEYYAEYSLDTILFKSTDEQQLQGQLYLTVEAESFSQYTITPTVQRKRIDHVIYVPLIEGIQQRITAHSTKEIVYFAFQDKDQEQSAVFIGLVGLQGDATAYIIAFAEGTKIQEFTEPSKINYIWSLSTHQKNLVIQTDDIDYIKNGKYRIAVYSDNDDVTSYEIQFSYSSSITILRTGTPHFEQIPEDSIRYYQISIDSIVEELLIIRTITSAVIDADDDVILYVSLTEPFPSNDSLTLSGVENTMLTLNYTYIRQSNQSIVHIAARSLGGTNEFSLLLRGKTQPTQLLESLSQVLPTPIKGHQDYIPLYFQLPNNQSVRIQVHTTYQKISILVNVVKQSQVQDYIRKLNNGSDVDYINLKSDFKALFPTFENYSYRSYGVTIFGQSVLNLDRSQLEINECLQSQCMLLINVALDQDQNIQQLELYGKDGTFEIEVSAQLMSIRPDNMIEGFTQNAIMEYYKLVVPHEVEMIEISLTALDDGDPDIFVKKQIAGDVEVFPTTDNYDFYSMSYKSDNLLISQTDPFFNESSIQGVYYIGILDFQNRVHFTLQVSLSKILLHTISSGQTLDKIILYPKSDLQDYYKNYAFFKYNHYSSDSFRIINQVPSGQIDIGVNRHGNGSIWQNKSISILESLPFIKVPEPNWIIINNQYMFGNILLVSKDSIDFCQFCTYIIGIRNIDTLFAAESSLSLVIEGSCLFLQPSRTIYDIANAQGNNYLFDTNNGNVIFQLTVYEGSADFLIGSELTLLTAPFKIIQNVTDRQSILLEGYMANTITLLVRPIGEQVKYSISGFLQNKQTHQIQFGKSEQGQIPSNQSVDLLVFSDGLTTNFFLQSSKEPQIQVSYIPDIGEETIVPPLEVIKRDGNVQMLLQMQQTAGYYKISLQNNENSQIEYQALINQHNLNYLIANSDQLFKSEVGQQQHFEIYLKENQKLYLELFECICHVSIEIPKEFQLQVNEKEQSTLQRIITVESSGDFFFNLSATSGMKYLNSPNEEALFAQYLIVPHVFDFKSQYPNKIYTVGNNGTISIEKSSIGGDFVISFDALECSEIDDKAKFQYSLHLTNDLNYLEAFSSCNLPLDTMQPFIQGNSKIQIEHKKIIRVLGQTGTKKINITADSNELSNATYYLTVIGQVFYENQTTPFQFKYQISSFRNEKLLDNETVNSNSTKEIQLMQQSTIYNFYNQNKITVIIGSIGLVCILVFVARQCWLNFRAYKINRNGQRISNNEQEDQVDQSKQLEILQDDEKQTNNKVSEY